MRFIGFWNDHSRSWPVTNVHTPCNQRGMNGTFIRAPDFTIVNTIHCLLPCTDHKLFSSFKLSLNKSEKTTTFHSCTPSNPFSKYRVRQWKNKQSSSTQMGTFDWLSCEYRNKTRRRKSNNMDMAIDLQQIIWISSLFVTESHHFSSISYPSNKRQYKFKTI